MLIEYGFNSPTIQNRIINKNLDYLEDHLIALGYDKQQVTKFTSPASILHPVICKLQQLF